MYDNYAILANKKNPLPKDYVPSDLVTVPIPFDDIVSCTKSALAKRMLKKRAAMAAKQLFDSSSSYGFQFFGVSGYRSYERQEELYFESLKKNGKTHTEKYIAFPGESEHQTGLALDVSISSLNFELIPEFSDTNECKWLHRNAPLFGFILRYPKGKEEITGYAYEPWHIRYVTKPLALYLDKTHLTLEEYHGLLFHLSP